jgi:ATP-dependent helicase/nuclease subunit A
VRSRSPLFRQIIAALKAHGLPIAGVDRSALTAPLAVQDLLSLLRFLATPEDNLSLAEVLRSPIGGWSEDDLFRLAHGREGLLWEALRHRAEEREDWAATHTMLRDLRDQSDFKRPYDLLERALVRHDARRRLIARLGARRRTASTRCCLRRWPMSGWRCRASPGSSDGWRRAR